MSDPSLTIRMPRWIAATLLIIALGPQAARAGELHTTSIAGDLDKVIELLDAGADVNEADPTGTPLIWAMFGQQAEVAKLLVDRGADPNVQTTGWTPLVSAIKMQAPDLIDALLAAGADPNGNEALIALAAAAELDDGQLAARLLAAGANPDARMSEARTALHVAAETGSAAVAQALLTAGANPNALTSSGKPALHFAVLNDNDAVAALLREAGARPGPVQPVAALLGTADLGLGKEEAQVCARCHAFAPVDDKYVEPPLWNIVNRKVGQYPDRPVSEALQQIGAIWDYDTLNRYIARPTEFAPGTTMDLVGISDPDRRANLILFLRSLSDMPAPLP